MEEKQYYIRSTKYSVTERQTKKHGKVYDVYFRIVEKDTLADKTKKLSGYPTKKEAKFAHDEFIEKHCELIKDFPARVRQKKKEEQEAAPPTVSELAERYFAMLSQDNKESTIYDKHNIFNSYILPQFKDTPITDLTQQVLYEWQDNLFAAVNPRTQQKYSHSYVLKLRSFFSAFLEWCEERYNYPNNFSKVKRPKKKQLKKEMEFWTKEEFEQFISVVDDPMYHCLFTVLFFTGRRKGEVFALTKNDIRKGTPTKIMFNKSLTRKTTDGTPYKITTTKADKSDLIPICARVSDELDKYKGQEPFFFGGEMPLAENTVTRAFEKYTKQANVKPIRMHDLRHSFVSMAIHLGANVNVIASLISDRVEQVFKTYGHLYVSDQIDLVNKLK